jgi:uncharacterized RDD family membrane protein YckC
VSVAARLRGHRRPPAAVVAPVVVGDDDVIEVAAPPTAYVGLVTRALAFGIDAALINAVALITTAIVTLTFSVLSLPSGLKAVAIAIGGVLYVVWVITYFVVFWSTTGQTPGNRVLRLRVCTTGGAHLRPRRALLRFGGLVLAAIPLFAGFLPVLVDDRRRGVHDMLARTVVVDAPRAAPMTSEARRAERLAARNR